MSTILFGNVRHPEHPHREPGGSSIIWAGHRQPREIFDPVNPGNERLAVDPELGGARAVSAVLLQVHHKRVQQLAVRAVILAQFVEHPAELRLLLRGYRVEHKVHRGELLIALHA